jgi:catechol 2,3-dioxygenase-like lactoylglutathione lyase family enzyme
MSRMLSHRMVVITLALITVGATAIIGQTPPPSSDASKGAVVGTGSFTAFVENMDRSLAFYHEAFGMEVPALPESGQRPYNQPNPQLFKWFSIPGARERHQSARLAGTRITVELMEIQDVEHRTVPLRIQDPGTATLVFLVRDVDQSLAKARQGGASIATPGGKPVTLTDGARAVLIHDIDNRFIELRQPAQQAGAAASGDLVDMRLSIAVNDMGQTLRFYRDVLGFTVDGNTPFATDKGLQALTGLDKAQVRRSRIQAPGSQLWIELVEFKGVERVPLRMKIQDRGAARLQLRVQNIDALVGEIKKAGIRIDSEAVPIPPNLKGALVADPNNFFLTPYAPCDGCAPGLPRPPAQ